MLIYSPTSEFFLVQLESRGASLFDYTSPLHYVLLASLQFCNMVAVSCKKFHITDESLSSSETPTCPIDFWLIISQIFSDAFPLRKLSSMEIAFNFSMINRFRKISLNLHFVFLLCFYLPFSYTSVFYQVCIYSSGYPTSALFGKKKVMLFSKLFFSSSSWFVF